MDEIRRGDILDFRGRLLFQGLSDSLVNRTLRVLKTALREGVFREDILRDPTIGIGSIECESDTRGVFTKDELKLVSPPDGIGSWGSFRNNVLFLAAASMGLRRGESLALR